jgi:uncharacterized surface protein with fasciclin (FAS1) repeats
MNKRFLTAAFASLTLALAACQNTTPTPNVGTENDPDVLGTMDDTGIMRDLEGNVVTARNGLSTQAVARPAGGTFTITFAPRQVVAPAVRVVHSSPDAPAVDVLVNDKVAIEDLAYQKQAGPASLAAGKYNVKVNVANTDTTAINADLTLDPKTYYAVYAVNKVANIEPLVLKELPFALGGVGLVRLLHGSPTAPNVDIYLSRPGRDINKLRPVLKNVPFKASSPYFAALPGQLQVRITPTGTKTVAIDATLEIKDGLLATAVAADAPGGGAPLGAFIVDELAGEPAPETPKSIVEIAAGNPDFSTLVSALGSAKLVEALSGAGPFTVFAPTNDAFKKLSATPEGEALKKVLLYHVASGRFDAKALIKMGMATTLEGSKIKVKVVDGAVILNDMVKVVTADIQASNGIIHVIDTVLIPPAPLKSIVEIASSNPAFSTLVGALKGAELVDALSGKGPFTVFAPTNDAFAKLSALPEGDALKKVLLYHVTSGNLNAKTLNFLGAVTTLEGSKIKVKVVDGAVILNDVVKVVTADIAASNGIIHVIDTVLIPPAPEAAPTKSIVEIATGDERFSTLVTALKSANLVEALSGPGPFTVFAPTNEAFSKLHALPEGDELKKVLLYHVVSGKLDSLTLAQDPSAITLQGLPLWIYEKDDGSLKVNNNSKIIIKDIQTTNGIIHVIDTVLIPYK